MVTTVVFLSNKETFPPNLDVFFNCAIANDCQVTNQQIIIVNTSRIGRVTKRGQSNWFAAA